MAVIGPHAAGAHLGGYSADPGTVVSILEGLRSALPGTEVAHAEGCRVTEGAEGPSQWWADEVHSSDPGDQDARIYEAAALASRADVVVLVVGGNEGTAREGWSREHLGDRDSIELPGRQLDLVSSVADLGKPVVAVVMGGRAGGLRRTRRRIARDSSRIDSDGSRGRASTARPLKPWDHPAP